MASNRIPRLLEPYLALPPATSLMLLTGTLGATTNWLVLRHLAVALGNVDRRGGEDGEGGHGGEVGVVLVSFLRNWDFWKGEAGRAGLDLKGESRAGRLAFVDGLEGLFMSQAPRQDRGYRSLRDPAVTRVEQDVLSVIKDIKRPGHQKEKQVALIVDGIDLHLALRGATVQGLLDTVGEWREHAHYTIFTVASDFPLMHSRTTPLEANHAAFVTSLAHEARLVMGVRGLDTGAARDISGVLRIAKGCVWEEQSLGGKDEVEDKEVLYFIGADGGAKVWER